MAANRIPAEVLTLIRDHVETYEHLELLYLLSEQQAGARDVETMASQLALPPPAVALAVEHLTRAGLVRRTAGTLVERHPDAAARLEGFARAYRDDRVEIMRAMTTNALDRVRTAALRAFASAFVIGKKTDG